MHQLEVTGNKGITFWEFFNNIEEYKKKRYINNFLLNNTHHFTGVRLLYECFKLHFGSVGSFYSSTTIAIIKEFAPSHIVDPFAGFGGRLIGALASGVSYTGYDTNIDLYEPYKQIVMELLPLTKDVDQYYNMTIKPAETVDFSKLKYDMVLTSPPYYNLELYPHTDKKTKEEWNTLYRTVFKNAYDALQDGGTFIINVNDEIYERVLIPLLGVAHDSVVYTRSKSGRYIEYLYVWVK
jgi:hypothetical protein